jgi:hypothetical protein
MIFANSFASAPVSIGLPGCRSTPISCASGVALIFSRADRVPEFGETEDAYDDRFVCR